MAKDQEKKKTNWGLKIFIWMLPLLVLVVGFFAGQAWMEHDKKTRPQGQENDVYNGLKTGAKDRVERLKNEVNQKDETENPKKEEDNEYVQVEIKGIEYYRLQVGSFTDRSGADKMVKKLSEMNYGGTTIDEDEKKKVVAMAFFGYDQAKGMKSSLEEHMIGAFPSKVKCSTINFQISSKNKRFEEFVLSKFVEVPKLLKELCDHYYIYENSGFDSKNYKTLMINQANKVSEMKTQLTNMDVGTKDQKVREKLLSFVDKYQKYLDSVGKMEKIERQTMWPTLVNLLEQYRELESINA